MASGTTSFLSEEHFDSIIAVIDLDMLQNNEELNLETN